MFFDVWSENASLFERLMEIYSDPPILYYGFKSFLGGEMGGGGGGEAI